MSTSSRLEHWPCSLQSVPSRQGCEDKQAPQQLALITVLKVSAERRRNASELRHWTALLLGMEHFVDGFQVCWCGSCFFLDPKTVRFKEVLLNVGLSHCFGAWLGRMCVETISWYFISVWFATLFLSQQLLRTPKWQVFVCLLIQFHMKVVGKC